MNKLEPFIDTLVKYWPLMDKKQKTNLCQAISTGNLIIILKILKEIENENKTN